MSAPVLFAETVTTHRGQHEDWRHCVDRASLPPKNYGPWEQIAATLTKVLSTTARRHAFRDRRLGDLGPSARHRSGRLRGRRGGRTPRFARRCTILPRLSAPMNSTYWQIISTLCHSPTAAWWPLRWSPRSMDSHPRTLFRCTRLRRHRALRRDQ